MGEVYVSLVDVVDWRRFRRADRVAVAARMEFTRQDDFARSSGDHEPVPAADNRRSDYLRWLVSWSGQNISACILVPAMFVVGGVEVRSARCHDRDRRDGRRG